MDTANSKIKKDADSYSVRLFDYIPVNPQMIEQVRRLDGFNVSAWKGLNKYVPNASQEFGCLQRQK